MANIKDVSANNNLDFYLDKKNVRNQELVTDTVDYIKTIAKDLFGPLEFLNLLWEQRMFVNENCKNPDTVIETLKWLPLTDAQKHVLYCFMLKWEGGYPVEPYTMGSDDDNLIANIYKPIEREFLNYGENTPEKEYCRRPRFENELIAVICSGLPYRIHYIDWWANGKAGGFVYDEKQNLYRFVGIEYDGNRKQYIRSVEYREDDLTNLPVKAKGFTAFLIHKWGTVEKATDYYDMYYGELLKKYI
jgi:hypothetical protein